MLPCKIQASGNYLLPAIVLPCLSGKKPIVSERPRTHGLPLSLVCRKSGLATACQCQPPEDLAQLCDSSCNSEVMSLPHGRSLAVRSWLRSTCSFIEWALCTLAVCGGCSPNAGCVVHLLNGATPYFIPLQPSVNRSISRSINSHNICKFSDGGPCVCFICGVVHPSVLGGESKL